jgi:hypothetical protein
VSWKPLWWCLGSAVVHGAASWLLCPRCPYCREKHVLLARHVAFDHADIA